MATLFNSIPIGEFFVDFVEAKNFVISFSQIFLVKRRHFLTLFRLTSFSLTLLKWQIWNFVISFSQIFLVKRRHFLTRFRLTSFSLTESTIYTNNFNTLSVHEFLHTLCSNEKLRKIVFRNLSQRQNPLFTDFVLTFDLFQIPEAI